MLGAVSPDCLDVRRRVGGSEKQMRDNFELVKVRRRVGGSENVGLVCKGAAQVRRRVGASEKIRKGIAGRM